MRSLATHKKCFSLFGCGFSFLDQEKKKEMDATYKKNEQESWSWIPDEAQKPADKEKDKSSKYLDFVFFFFKIYTSTSSNV